MQFLHAENEINKNTQRTAHMFIESTFVSIKNNCVLDISNKTRIS